MDRYGGRRFFTVCSKSGEHVRAGSANVVIDIIFFIAILSFCTYVSSVRHIGMADNGDFWRLMSTIGVKHSTDDVEHRQLYHVRIHFIQEHGLSLKQQLFRLIAWFPGSCFTALSYVLNRAIGNGRTYYNLTVLAIIYCITYSFAVTFLCVSLIKTMSIWSKLCTYIVAFCIFGDSLFVTYFTSFYQEPSFLIMFILTMALLCAQISTFNIDVVSIFLTSISKIQNIIFSIYYCRLFSKSPNSKLSRFAVITLLCIISLGLKHFNESNRFLKANIFESFFTGLTVQSDNPQVILADFGLQAPKYINFVGKTYYQARDSFSEELKQDFSNKVTFRKIIVYYLDHPQLLLHALKYAFSTMLFYDPRPEWLGNFTEGDGLKRQQFAGICMFSRHFGLFLVITIIISIAYICIDIRTRNIINVVTPLISLLLLPVLMVEAFVAAGFFEYKKHMFSFCCVVAVLLIMCTVRIVRNIEETKYNRAK